jgi:hypothetical protein
MSDLNLEQALHEILGLDPAGPGCLGLPRLQAALERDDWSSQEQRHVHSCACCRRRLEQARRAADDLDLAALTADQPPAEDEVATAVLDLFADIPPLRQGKAVPVRLVLVPGHPEPDLAGLEQRSGTETRVLPRPSDARSWSLRTVHDDPILPLPEELALRFYGDVGVRRLSLWLHALPVADRPGWFRPQLEVFAAPTHAPMNLVLTFADGQARTLVVAPRPSRRRARSEPGEPLPAEAFAFGDPGKAPRAEPTASLPRLELRSAACRVAAVPTSTRGDCGLQTGPGGRELVWLIKHDYLQGLNLRVRNWPTLAWPGAESNEGNELASFGVDAFVLAACREKCSALLPTEWSPAESPSRNVSHELDRRARVG